MKKYIFLGYCSLAFCTLISAQSKSVNFKKIKELGGIEEYLYEPNGMSVLLLQDNASPVATVQIVYRVGSKHEVLGNTGSTHLLEHLMFKGTPTFNKKNKNSIPDVLQNNGAQINATTWYDRTNYYETLPSDKIELALKIEADRMRNSLLLKEDKEAEMTVVRNEFERGENNPNSLLDKEIWASAYIAHPYHHSTIGWKSDIEKAPIEVLKNFYNTYYWPDNATLTIIGDFRKENVFELIEKYFGKITKAPHVMPQPYTEEPQQYGARKIVVRKPGELGVVNKAYKIPGALNEDLPALNILAQIIGNGPSAILNKTFVDTRLGNYSYASATNFKEVGLFTIGVGFPTTSKHEDIDAKISEVVAKIQKDGVTQDEVNRVVAKISAQTVLKRDGSGVIASELNEAIASGDWTDYITGIDRLKKVTPADVLRVANKYLVEDQSTTGYFIPKQSGSQNKDLAKANNFVEENGPFYYRHPENEDNHSECNSLEAYSENNALEEITKAESAFEKTASAYKREKVSGIDVVSVKTSAKDFVTVAASISLGNYAIETKNDIIPALTASMLSKGTTLNDKFKFSEKLQKLGVSLNVSASSFKINIGFKCLKKDLDQVVVLLAEELRNPLFDAKEFENLKQQFIGNTQQSLNSPGERGDIALSQAIYPKGNPNYSLSVEENIENIKKATLEEIKVFHKKYFGPASMRLVIVGDTEGANLNNSLKKSFKNWNGGVAEKLKFEEASKAASKTEVVTIPEKPSAELFIGQYTGLKRADADYIPFYIGNYTLGAGFAGRLMQTVRDNDGLTYNISSGIGGNIETGGYWYVNASFNPNLFQKGLDATMVQVDKWVKDGITAEELENKKTNLIGSFKVGMSTTSGMARTILGFIERGLEPNYIDQYPKDIEKATLQQVNDAIKKYVKLDKMIVIKAGSLDQSGNPLK
ncbi:M16 family metallopeptidase [Flavobacterium quisquiliarum]|uniref:M16 family metallopeptidase n=1 Tax=Flavobacterium quisquiliarum TaxID=1834436 RepID=A0ABV8W1Q0_9FLAO|nr:pitrilysin family protein [Flavobacterium quisquiliarum]MBW1654645.1 insulinase family protein [Flavobacterium quisquiliarum]NWL01671.1 insulinase family protein [Flavobacterium collinsii]